MIEQKTVNFVQLNIKKGIEKYYFIGLAILRPILAFLVVVTHYYDAKYAKGIWKLIYIKTERNFYHVRIFFIMSFYFSYKTLISNTPKKNSKRFERLFVPYFVWPIIIFFLNKCLIHFFKIKIKNNLTIDDLKRQLLLGYEYIFSLWYQWTLIFMTIFFILIIFIFKKDYNFILIIISIISFIFQYNGKNYQYFKQYNV